MVATNSVFKALLMLTFLKFAIVKAVSNENQAAGFTFLGTRQSYSDVTKEFNLVNYYMGGPDNWTLAQEVCQYTFGPKADLVSIETEEEQAAIIKWINERRFVGFLWTSGAFDVLEGRWKWIGNPDYDFLIYEKWPETNGRPIDPTEFGRVLLDVESQYWNSVWYFADYTESWFYICELESEANVGTESSKTDLA